MDHLTYSFQNVSIHTVSPTSLTTSFHQLSLHNHADEQDFLMTPEEQEHLVAYDVEHSDANDDCFDVLVSLMHNELLDDDETVAWTG